MVECRICDHEVAGLNLVVSLHQHQLYLPSHLWSVIEYQQKLGSKLAYHVTSLSLSLLYMLKQFDHTEHRLTVIKT